MIKIIVIELNGNIYNHQNAKDISLDPHLHPLRSGHKP